MKNLDLKPIFQGLKKTVTDNSSKILLWVGVTCSISAIVTTVPATIKAVKLVEKKKEVKKVEKLTFWDTIKETWYCYIPSVVLGTVSVLCVVESASIASKKTAAIAAAYQLTASALEEYQQEVVNKIGEKKEREVQENVSKQRVQNNPVSDGAIIITSHGKTLCFDSVSGRYFSSDIDKINKIVNELNRDMLSSIDGSITLNQFYEELMLDPISIGDELGWTSNKGLIEMKYSSTLAENNVPCLVLDYRVRPTSL